MSLDSTTWAALALVLTLLGAAYTVLAWRRRGPAAGLRGLAWTLLPVAAWLTGTLRLAVDVGDAVGDWATRLVLDPRTWAGVIVFGVSVVLFLASGALLGRGIGVRRAGARRGVRGPDPATTGPGGELARGGASGGSGDAADGAVIDDDVAEILKRRGIG